MARFKRRGTRRTVKSSRRRSRGNSEGGMFKNVIAATAYGAGRGYASNLVKPLTNKLGMLGTYADNAVMIGVLWGLAKVLPAARPIAKTGILIEAAMVGGEIIQQVAPATGTASQSDLFNGGGLA